MPITSKDIISLSDARAKLTELCEEVRTKGTEKIITIGWNASRFI